MFQPSILFLLLITFTLALQANGRVYVQNLHRDLPDTIGELNRRIAALQAHRTCGYTPPLTWAKERGAYESNMRLNTFGKPWLADFRQQVGVYDNNVFTTAWVTICLLEAVRYGRDAPVLSDDQMKQALQLINSHHDKNDHPGKAAINFWSETFNQSSGLWTSNQINMVSIIHLLDDTVPWDFLLSICDKLGLSKEACDVLEYLKAAKSQLLPNLHIPTDFDGSLVNVGLGSLLKDLRLQYPEWYPIWEAGNTTSATFELLKKYAYRPLSATVANVIDPRTYYYARGFIEKAQSERKNVALVTTWIQNLSEERVLYDKGISMPLHVNNVDTAVAANVVYGITAALIEDMFEPQTWFDEDVMMLYENATSFIEWVIDSGTMTTRPDLALPYYPSRYNFYWFVARTRFLIACKSAKGSLPHLPSLRFVYERLNKVLRVRVTTDILAEAKEEGKWVYFDDFLGGADQTWEGKPKNSADDRLFTTSMVVNTLIAAWTTQDNVTARLIWAKETPASVIRTVEQAVSWLNEFILTDRYKPLNAFFSGPEKGASTFPFFYPINLLEYINGTKLPLNDTHVPLTRSLVLAMSGTVPEDQYAKMVQEPHFGHKTPTSFPGYNQDIFLFWSCEAYTHASVLLAFSQFLNLHLFENCRSQFFHFNFFNYYNCY